MPSPQIVKERRWKAATDSDAGEGIRRRGGSFMKRGELPAKKLSLTSSWPTTAGLTPAGKSAAEAKADAIVADVRAEVDARMAEKTDVPTGGANAEVIGHAPGGDFIYDLNPGDLEKEFYAQMAQADLALEAFDAGLTMEQLMTLKEDEERTKAEPAATEAAKAKSEQVAVPATLVQPSDAPTAPTGVADTPTGGVKRSSSGASAPSSKRLRRKPVILGTRDG